MVIDSLCIQASAQDHCAHWTPMQSRLHLLSPVREGHSFPPSSEAQLRFLSVSSPPSLYDIAASFWSNNDNKLTLSLTVTATVTLTLTRTLTLTVTLTVTLTLQGIHQHTVWGSKRARWCRTSWHGVNRPTITITLTLRPTITLTLTLASPSLSPSP